MLNLIDIIRKKFPEYVQLGLSVIPENAVIISLGAKKHSAVFFHLLYEPQIIGLILPESLKDFKDFEHIKALAVVNKRMPKIDFSVSFELQISFDGQTVLLFRVIAADLHAGGIKRWYINRFLQRALLKNEYVVKHFDAAVFDKIISFFAYPKPVFVISTPSQDSNSFPVDTCRKLGSHYLLGVRNSNRIMANVAIGDSFFIGISDFSKRHLIYQLGKYSDGQNRVSYRKDEETGIMIPEVASAGDRVILENIIPYENQSVFVARVVSEATQRAGVPFLAHIHKTWLLSKQIRNAYF